MGQLDIFNVIRHTIRQIQMGQLDNGIIGQFQHDTSHNQRDTSYQAMEKQIERLSG